jgi:hypothetical protein
VAYESERTPLASRVLARILEHRKPLDYLWLTAFAALPIALAAFIGVLFTTDGFLGYWDRLNWRSLVVLLPLAAFTLRWIAKRIGPVSSRDLPSTPPPVVDLIETDAGKENGYAALRGALLSPMNLYSALLITLLIHVADMTNLGGFYLSGASQVCPLSEASQAFPAAVCAQEKPKEQDNVQWLLVTFAGAEFTVERDWSVAYLSSEAKVDKWPNLALNASAYSVQFALVFIGILQIILILRHNLFFLSRIYQRRRVTTVEEHSYIHIDLDDKDRCFGFRPANDAFNVQVLTLTIAAVFILFTRFANVNPGDGLFPDIGQWLAVLAWLAALAIVSLPILVKLLPRIPSRGTERVPVSLIGYLREFLPDEAWAIGNDTPPEEVNAVAARFAENAFWPTGNNRAWQLYFLSFWVFFIALVPDPRAIEGLAELPAWWMIVSWAASGVLAWGATWALFRFLRAMLTYIDNRLVELPAQPIGAGAAPRRRKIPIGVFISYRREDTAAYTGRLYDSLSNHLDKDRVFRDLDTIHGGVDFVAEMIKAIDSAQAMIVVIGPQWLTIARGDGPPRIEDPSDFVYQEVALGLQRGIRVIPVLVGGATMPSEDDLPDDLEKLAGLNKREISDSRWAHDVGLLIKDLETVPHASQAGIS